MSQQEWPKADSEMDEVLSALIQKNAESGNEHLACEGFRKEGATGQVAEDAAAALMLAEEMRRAIAALIPREEILKGFVAYCYHSSTKSHGATLGKRGWRWMQRLNCSCSQMRHLTCSKVTAMPSMPSWIVLNWRGRWWNPTI